MRLVSRNHALPVHAVDRLDENRSITQIVTAAIEKYLAEEGEDQAPIQD